LGNLRSDDIERCGNVKDLGLGRRPSTSDTIGDIQRAAKEEFAAHGFDCATVDGIARKAKVSKQLLYYYFGSKADLYTLILEEAAVETTVFKENIDLDQLRPERALKVFIDNIFLDYLHRPQIIQMTMDEAQHGFAHVGKRGSLAGVLKDAIKVLEKILVRGAEDGVFRDKVDADALFWTIYGMVTTWFCHSPMISLVSGTNLEGDLGLERWRDYSVGFVLNAVIVNGSQATDDTQ
jgi:AcrR family transcriptional regulator